MWSATENGNDYRRSPGTAIQKLNPKELAELREWFFEYEWDAWDRQLERNVQSGRLDKLGKKVLADHAASKTKPL